MLWLVKAYMDCETDQESSGDQNSFLIAEELLQKKKKG